MRVSSPLTRSRAVRVPIAAARMPSNKPPKT
jgi:hypothetical protein